VIIPRDRDECLNVTGFLSREDAREKIEKWRKDDNGFRPRSSLGDLTPRQFADKFERSLQSQENFIIDGTSFGVRLFMGDKREMGRRSLI
jgi:hypothetical protein